MFNFLVSNKKKDTEFSRFFREASSSEKKKVFREVIRKATEDQRRILNKPITTKTA
ncbi:MAG: hypothetical protein UR80_C0007G0013 [Parcubacteria group bacterium GW2011_GWB1_35_5]|nr:MAG: hypothetical protein UR80_C0007G0013 [Parcubacteria group bacterium GW2011_GWB1_35_5]